VILPLAVIGKIFLFSIVVLVLAFIGLISLLRGRS
jgi:hypothetical protein